MQQIADWLEKLGMSEYAQRFAENKIDVPVLRHLTDQDLKDIGVAGWFSCYRRRAAEVAASGAGVDRGGHCTQIASSPANPR
jgi:hypothetical protein